jgi:hypothetical protein
MAALKKNGQLLDILPIAMPKLDPFDTDSIISYKNEIKTNIRFNSIIPPQIEFLKQDEISKVNSFIDQPLSKTIYALHLIDGEYNFIF